MYIVAESTNGSGCITAPELVRGNKDTWKYTKWQTHRTVQPRHFRRHSDRIRHIWRCPVDTDCSCTGNLSLICTLKQLS